VRLRHLFATAALMIAALKNLPFVTVMLRLFVGLAFFLSLAAVAPAVAQDAADMVVRLNRLEGQARQMSGQIEQLQHENRQLKEQLRRFQEDVEFRFQERGGAARAQVPATTPGVTASQTPGSPAQPRPQARRGDAFDPAAQPNAPGAPRQLGTTAPPASPATGSAAALPPTGRTPPGAGPTIGQIIEDDEAPPSVGAPLDLGAAARGAPAAPAPRPSVAATGTGDPRADYDAAYAYILQKQYEQAEMSFRQFLQSHPRDRLASDATYWLGESYLARNRPREAAEQFLKVSTEHARSSKAPDAMLKLGVALNALGARDQACATFAELERKYPQAAPNVRQGVERERTRARCAA
jgi:tol-pal system protein YbgF